MFRGNDLKKYYIILTTICVFFSSVLVGQIFIPLYGAKTVSLVTIPDTEGPQNISVARPATITNSKILDCTTTYFSATSSNTTVLSLANITFSGVFPNCIVSFLTLVNSGSSNVTITFKNEYNQTASTSFVFTAYQKPIMAFSFRKILKDYLGSAIRVRRVLDDVEADIGFDSNGNFDLAAYNSFIGASSGTLRTWYDQSGNGYDATQATKASQPTLTMASFNGAPQVNFSGTYWLQTTQAQNVMTFNRDVTVFFATKATTFNQVNFGTISGSINDRVLIHVNWGDNNVYWDAPGPCCGPSRLQYPNAVNVNVAKVYVFGRNDTYQYLKINGTTVASKNDASGTLQPATAALFWYLGSGSAGGSGQSVLAEYMQYLSGLTDSQVDAITTEQKNYFGL